MNTLDTYVTNFSHYLDNAITAIENAAKTYVDALKAYPDTAQEAFQTRYPHVSTGTWARLRSIGHGDANPNIMFFSDKFATKVMRMDRKTQDSVLNGDSFDVFNPTTRKAERITYGNLKPRHERILFDDNAQAMRTIHEQKVYADLLAASRKKTYSPYVVNGDKLEVYSACTITKGEVEDILEEMEK